MGNWLKKKDKKGVKILVAIAIISVVLVGSFFVFQPNINGFFQFSVLNPVDPSTFECSDVDIRSVGSTCDILNIGNTGFIPTKNLIYRDWYGAFVMYPKYEVVGTCTRPLIQAKISIPGGEYIEDLGIWAADRYVYHTIEPREITFIGNPHIEKVWSGLIGETQFEVGKAFIIDDLPGEYKAEVTYFNCDNTINSVESYNYYHLYTPPPPTVCGDTVCEGDETELTCPVDCYVAPIEEPPEEIPIDFGEPINPLHAILVVAIVLLIVAIIYLSIRK